MVNMKKRMKAILHKRVHSIRESVLRQRNENYAQKFLSLQTVGEIYEVITSYGVNC